MCYYPLPNFAAWRGKRFRSQGKMDTSDEEDSGYECDFVTVPDDSLFCRICLNVAKDPRQHGACGQLYCKTCLERYKSRNTDCPYCKRKRANYFEDNRSHRQIQSLNVKCENDCSWEGELRSMRDHLKKKCPYQFIQCPLACGSLRIRADMDEHTTKECPNHDTDCPDCGLTMKYSCFVKEHKGQCLYALEQCPAPGCDMEICSLLLPMHTQTDCQYTMVECRYKNAGCHTVLRRGDMEEHEKDDKYHLQILSGSLSSLNSQHNELKASFESLQSKLYYQSMHSTTFKMFNFTCSGLRHFNFQPMPNTYNLRFSVLYGKTITVSFAVIPGRHDDHLKWPFHGDVKVELLNQLEDDDHYSKTISLYPFFRPRQKPHYRYQDKYLFTEFKTLKEQYYLEDKAYFRITVISELCKPWLE